MNELEKVKHELKITEQILSERQRVLDAIPECPIHGGNCVPYALEWIEKQKGNHIECAIKVGMVIEYTTNWNWDVKGRRESVKAFSIAENKVWLGNGIIAIDGFLRNIETGRYKLVEP